jgi:hypothetical protein
MKTGPLRIGAVFFYFGILKIRNWEISLEELAHKYISGFCETQAISQFPISKISQLPVSVIHSYDTSLYLCPHHYQL